MNCLECQELLQRRLDGEPLTDRAALDQHLAGCAECRERLAAAQRLMEGLRGLHYPAPSADLAQRTTDRVLQDRLRRLRLRRRVGWLLAASVLLATAAGSFWAFTSSPQTAVVVVVSRARETPVVPPVPLGQTIGGAREALAGLLGRLAEKTREQTALFRDSAAPLQFVSTEALPRVNLLTQPLDSATQGLRQAGEGTAIG
ncbi:MAG TPA: zf-HC2 domain-containing protein, partial [Gemmataceae bacterium]|nr:zf-HC2 domain-containing protein [Gemmataceae bacterium]